MIYWNSMLLGSYLVNCDVEVSFRWAFCLTNFLLSERWRKTAVVASVAGFSLVTLAAVLLFLGLSEQGVVPLEVDFFLPLLSTLYHPYHQNFDSIPENLSHYTVRLAKNTSQSSPQKKSAPKNFHL